MKNFKLCSFGIVIIWLLNSCQDVITLDLNPGPSKLVVNGYISTQSGPYTIKLSRSSSYYEPNAFVPEKGASVVVSDNTGIVEIFKESSPGVYSSSNLQGQINRTYLLSITTVDKQVYTASSYLPTVVAIDSLHFELRKRFGGFGSGGKGPASYTVSCIFTDPVGLGNNYRIRYYKNDTLQNGERDYVIGSDKYGNAQSNTPRIADGQINTLQIRGRYYLKDSVQVDLISIDQKAFNYYSDLQKLLSDQNSPFPSDAPANPINNIGNGGLGYFAAFSISSKKIVIH
jgi:hypothetical protein